MKTLKYIITDLCTYIMLLAIGGWAYYFIVSSGYTSAYEYVQTDGLSTCFCGLCVITVFQFILDIRYSHSRKAVKRMEEGRKEMNEMLRDGEIDKLTRGPLKISLFFGNRISILILIFSIADFIYALCILPGLTFDTTKTLAHGVVLFFAAVVILSAIQTIIDIRYLLSKKSEGV